MHFFLYISVKLWYNRSIKWKKEGNQNDIANVNDKVPDGEVAQRQ